MRHLLEHTSGLPLSSLLAHNIHDVTKIEEVASFAAKARLAFDPGTGFSYSDDGADTLAAIVGKASGQSAESFVAARIAEPLGMRDSFCVAPTDRTRFVTGYAGTTGAWNRFWSRDDQPMFRCFLGSQAMYSTCADYAKLLRLWANDGMLGERRLLSHAAIERALKPAHAMDYPSRTAGTTVFYGQMWMIWATGEGDGKKLVAFGHGGSDGTMAWYWPERDLMILYFTQSRGGLTPVSLEGEIDRHLFGGATVTRDARDLDGLYWDAERERYVALIARDGALTIELPGRFSGALVPRAPQDSWAFELDPASTISVERDATGGASALAFESKGTTLHWPRLVPDAGLPSADQLVASVIAAHGIPSDGLPFPILRKGTSDVPALKRHVEVTQRFQGFRMRVESVPAQGPTQIAVSDGHKSWSKVGDKPAQELTGALGEQSLLEHPARAFGDWRKAYRTVQVVARVHVDGAPRLLVRCVPSVLPASCMIVDEASGRVVGIERIATIPGLGAVGVALRLDDFRAITHGDKTVTLPFHATATFTSALLGTSETRIESAETPEQFDAATFTIQ